VECKITKGTGQRSTDGGFSENNATAWIES
jgi:hypothetical protein